VFGVSGIAKLANPAGFSKSLREFGVPNSLKAFFAILLIVAELSVAAALLSTRYAWWGAVGATLLLMIFVAAISLSLYKGIAPACRCFGQLHSGSAGIAALVRNEMLAAVSCLLIWQMWNNPGPGFLTVLSRLTASQIRPLLVVLALVGLFAM